MKKIFTVFLAYLLVFPFIGACTKSDNEAPSNNGEEPQDTTPAPVPFVHIPDSSKVLIIGIDGCLPAAITAELMPNLYNLAQESYFASNALADVPTWSATGWASIHTGTGPEKHNYLINEWSESKTRLATYPSFFKYLKELKPNWRTSSIVAWSVLHNFLIKQDMVTMRYSSSDDGSVENKVKQELQRDSTSEVTFVHFDGVDHIGHDANPGGSYSTDSTRYRAAVTTVDARLGRIVTTLKARPTYNNENWLIVVVTDHGGIGTGHGGASYSERNAFIVLNNKNITPTLVNTPPTVGPSPVDADADGYVLYKDGIYATLPKTADLDFDANKSFTIEMDVRSDVLNYQDPSFFGNKDWNNGNNPGITFVTRNNGELLLNVADGSNRVDLRFDGVLFDKVWHRISVTYNRVAGKLAVYIDGTKRTHTSINGDVATFATMGSLTSTFPFRVAQDGTGVYGNQFNGGIKELRIFSGVAVDSATVVSYHAKAMDASHPNAASLAIYNPGSYTALQLNGALGKPALDITTGEAYNYYDAPHLYSIVPTIFKFYGLEIKSEYKWDGVPLVNF